MKPWMFMILALVLVSPIAHADEVMTFEGQPPPRPSGIFGTAWTIFADGDIDEDVAERFRDFLKRNKIPRGSSIVLNSPGGDILASMEFGRLIREHGLTAYIGTKDTLRIMNPGFCLSACALAYLGGKFRFITADSVYGVHRFYRTDDTAQSDDEAQILSAAIAAYIREMGVDPALFSEMTKAGSDDMNILKGEKLLALKVVNNGIQETKWSIESIPEGLYLRGQQETIRGMEKIIFGCNKGTIHMMGIFTGSNETLGARAASLTIDREQVRLEPPQVSAPQLLNGMENVTITLDEPVLAKVGRAKSLGIILQFSYDAPTFVGIRFLDFTGGAPLLPGFVKNCQVR